MLHLAATALALVQVLLSNTILVCWEILKGASDQGFHCGSLACYLTFEWMGNVLQRSMEEARDKECIHLSLSVLANPNIKSRTHLPSLKDWSRDNSFLGKQAHSSRFQREFRSHTNTGCCIVYTRSPIDRVGDFHNEKPSKEKKNPHILSTPLFRRNARLNTWGLNNLLLERVI